MEHIIQLQEVLNALHQVNFCNSKEAFHFVILQSLVGMDLCLNQTSLLSLPRTALVSIWTAGRRLIVKPTSSWWTRGGATYFAHYLIQTIFSKVFKPPVIHKLENQSFPGAVHKLCQPPKGRGVCGWGGWVKMLLNFSSLDPVFLWVSFLENSSTGGNFTERWKGSF